ncbi:hypothetical protein [Carboxylicivirga caseinilyticus]|uniref:hypothetical protein n=1 Tax=Carboxylicivirga caseinilyticus TaxID=3417572 RepID=UPI003D3355CB|nr:hypothetical protein [Marinilabiliaceae bacterium A049]
MKKKTTFRLSIMVILFTILINPVKAQDALTFTKEIETNNPSETKETVSNLTLALIEKTNANVCAQCKEKNLVIIEGQIPLTLSKNPFDLAYTFNGYINYKLEVNYENGIRLTFTNLNHESKNSINGFDLSYGQLYSNGTTSKHAVYRNYNFLIEDYSRITLFNSDNEMAELIKKAALNNIEELIAVK